MLTELEGNRVMSEHRSLAEKLVRFCAPTLANIKTGSLFSCGQCNKCDIDAEVRKLNRILRDKGLRLIPIVTGKAYILLYLYRVNSLARDMKGEETKKILKGCGYTGSSPEICVKQLIERIRENDVFPHEIGLFLGYPPKDVKGFMDNSAQNYLLCGRWKVYHDPETALKAFRSYEICEKKYLDYYRNGYGIEKLAVAG